MFPYGPFNPAVPSGPVLRRYDRSPPHASLSQPVRPPANYGPPSQDVELILRQEPKEALVTTEGKEKARKPVDPPPIIQLKVKAHADPSQHFLQSPYLFMCTSLYKSDKDEAWEGGGNKSLAGSLVSSLHRLKDVDNRDGGFFVFGDISVKVQGHFRLHFSLFDLRKDTLEVVYLGSITSAPFRVLLPKDFKGMDESTYLSRAFSDQGVRLRLRKEPRAMMGGTKRQFPYAVADSSVPNTPLAARPNSNIDAYSYSDDLSQSPAKRHRPSGKPDRKDQYPGHSPSGYQPSYSQPQYPARQPSFSGLSGMLHFNPNFTGLTTGSTPPFTFRPSLGGSSSFVTDSLSSTSAIGNLSSQQRFQDFHQPFSNLYNAPYAQQRGSQPALSFGEDSSSGLGAYRTSTAGLGDHRPTTAAGGLPPFPLSQHTHPQHSSHTSHASHASHDSLGSSRGPALSHSPELLRTNYADDQPGF
ncbi:uncharacterized protein K441DRAFT_96890 [Cenococcum geophilum 1.58]|uniref:uncharacterized protein n=1 Tax=Cenococcum geophilum 1.58 TaxID=794803 RepID=UPI00358F65C2|nr:hypothetical protein K441DRAFT_96890 [Cenococcum geophilum 1.58]